jgi:hypothetical protein
MLQKKLVRSVPIPGALGFGNQFNEDFPGEALQFSSNRVSQRKKMVNCFLLEEASKETS